MKTGQKSRTYLVKPKLGAQVGIRLPDRDIERLNEIAEAQTLTVSDLVRKAVRQYLDAAA
jgi:predicted transcriptional regulator